METAMLFALNITLLHIDNDTVNPE